ncbi:MAG: 50S ribosomal protein L20 [Candidatus Hydrogenedentota bacterium]|nr:MAG: 50S ribosomal protein L20 [Candidatus Hydrogenedentota bacterium]
MMRAVNGTIHKNRRKKILKRAKGFLGGRGRLYRTAKDAVMKSGQWAYRDRRVKKRDFRRLWITRINAACRQEGISYSKFMHGLNKNNVKINRKQLSELAIHNPEAFKKLVELSKSA